MKTKNDFLGIAFSEVMCGIAVTLGQMVFAYFLEKNIANAVIRGVAASAIAIVIAAYIGCMIQRMFVRGAKASNSGRRKLYEVAKYEGKWIERINNRDEYAICTLEYNSEKDGYDYRGRHYRTDGEVVDFKSKIVVYENGELHYITEGTNVPDKDIRGLVPCYGRIEMGVSNNGLCATGEFNDLLDNAPLISFSMRRIDKGLLCDFFANCEGKDTKSIKKLENELDTEKTGREFIKWYSQNRCRYM